MLKEIYDFIENSGLELEDTAYVFGISEEELKKYYDFDYDFKNDPNTPKIKAVLDYFNHKPEYAEMEWRLLQAKRHTTTSTKINYSARRLWKFFNPHFG